MGLTVVPLGLREAIEFVASFHRHSKPPTGGKFAIGATDEGELVGVAIVARPVARMLNDSFTAEVIRLCARPDAPKNSCSFLYGRCWRIWQQMGGKRLVTYTLQTESGASLRGAGWKLLGEIEPGPWDRPSRRRDWQPV
jgi:hypothetical protein